MPSLLGLVGQAMGYGFTAGTAPGPLHSFLGSVTLSQGWRYGVLVMLAPLITDIPIIIAMVFILESLPDTVISLIQIIGGVFVLWLAWSTWKLIQADIGISVQVSTERVAMTSRDVLLRAITVNYLSPGPYVFWGTINGPLLRDALNQSAGHALAFLIGFYGTFLFIMMLWLLAFDRLRRVDPIITRNVLRLTIVVLALLGVVLIGQGVGVL